MKKHLRYKGIEVNAFGLPVFNSNNSKSITKFSESGKRYYQYQCFTHNYKSNTPRTMIVMYDIPKEQRKERNWLRRHLLKFDYIMIQKSVWVGPSPLPRDFLDYTKKIGLTKQLITLKLNKHYSKGDRNL